MSAQTSLNVLTVLGVAALFLGGLIARFRRESVGGDGERKILTRAGRWALAFSIVGFVGAFSSELVRASIRLGEETRAKEREITAENRHNQELDWR